MQPPGWLGLDMGGRRIQCKDMKPDSWMPSSSLPGWRSGPPRRLEHFKPQAPPTCAVSYVCASSSVTPSAHKEAAQPGLALLSGMADRGHTAWQLLRGCVQPAAKPCATRNRQPQVRGHRATTGFDAEGPHTRRLWQQEAGSIWLRSCKATPPSPTPRQIEQTSPPAGGAGSNTIVAKCQLCKLSLCNCASFHSHGNYASNHHATAQA
jgi:hypothetical protein